jgi:hypothetical protein
VWAVTPKRFGTGPVIRPLKENPPPPGEIAMNEQPRPPFSAQQQPMPGETAAMHPRPDHGEKSYKGSGKLKGLKAVITGGDSGIGRAVAIAFSRICLPSSTTLFSNSRAARSS